MTLLRVREAGDAAVFVELGETIDPDVNARVLAAADGLRAAALPGVRDVVPTYRSVAVFFDPLQIEPESIVELVTRAAGEAPRPRPAATVEIPVEYGGDAGPDLDELAAASGLSPADVVARHTAREYRVFMVGFLPGFAYLGSVDETIAASRRPSPRLRVPAGSVGIAGRQTGVYPRTSPGGWQIIGRTTTRPFVADRLPPALMAAGDTVRFVAAPPGTLESFDDVWTPAPSATAPPPRSGRSLTIVQPGLLTTVQDAGRWGHQHAGVPVSGALDLASLAAANRCVGNAPGTAAIEATLPGLEVRADVALRIGLAGADLGAELDGRAVSATGALACGAGQVLRFTRRGSGARAYVAIAGGVDSVPVLGSRATDLSSGLGGLAGARLRAGDVVPVGPPHGTGEMASRAEPAPQALPRVPRGGARVRVMPGPHGEWFPPEALTALARERFAITPDSNRMGYRLRAGAPLPRRPGELISDATCAGALQVTPSGEPILLMADRQVTGGYPIIATVITADLGIAGQLAPGDWIEFEPCTRADALRALAALRAGA